MMKKKFNKSSKDIIVNFSNLFYKETNESLRKKLEKYGDIEKLYIEKTKDNYATGKGNVKFKNLNPKIFTDNISSYDNKILFIQETDNAKKTKYSRTRFFISNIKKNLDKPKITNILKKHGYKVKVTLKQGNNKRNLGYCFLEFMDVKEAKKFYNEIDEFIDELGEITMENATEKYNIK